MEKEKRKERKKKPIEKFISQYDRKIQYQKLYFLKCNYDKENELNA